MRSRAVLTAPLLVVLSIATGARPASAQNVASRDVTVNVNLVTRTSLKVSSRLLRFDVTQPNEPATAEFEFSAGARMPAGCDVVLTVEPERGLDGPGGAADAAADLRFSGEGQGLLAGPIAMGQNTVVGRWQGSGLREGRVVFTLRASAPGSYSLPVRIGLSTP